CSSPSSRVLPTPESPATKASEGRPAAASASAASSSASSAERPTKVELDTRRATSGPSRNVPPEIGDRRSPPCGVLGPGHATGIGPVRRPCLTAPAAGPPGATSREDPRLCDRRLEQRGRGPQVLRVVALGERRVDRAEQPPAAILCAALAPQPREARRRAQ